MATPRRSSRIASRTPSAAGSDAGSDAGDRRINRASKAPPNAGQVGRLTTTRPATSNAYGATGSDDRSSAQPEMVEAPTVRQGFAVSFRKSREGSRASAPRTLTEDDNNNNVRVPPTIPEAHEASTASKAPSSIRAASPRSTFVHPPASNESRMPSPSAARNNDDRSVSNDGHAPAALNDDGRPVSRDTNESSFAPTKSWNDLREAAFVGWATYSPRWYDIARRIVRNYLAPLTSVISTLSKISAMVIGFLSTLIFFFLLFDVTIKSVILRNTSASDYMHERSSQIIGFVTGSESIYQPFPITGDVNNIGQVDIRIMKKDLDYLKAKIPEFVMLTHNPKTGRNEIPGPFWHALRDNLAKEGISTGDVKESASWTNFWQHNKAQLDTYLSDAVDAKVKNAIGNNTPVTNDTFIGMVESEFKLLQNRVADMESSWNKNVNKKFKDLVATLPKGQLETMANTVLLENAWAALHSVNFFSRALGAVVDPHLTSPTMASRGLTRRVLQKLTWIPGDLPPAAVLVGWEEPTDCWCAARSPGTGKAQIGIVMPHKIVPETLLVEHIPRDGTLDIGSAPRGMEVWVEVEDEGVRAALGQPEDRPGEKFVRVGSFEYRVDALNHVQAFNLNSELLTQSPVNKVVVRVTGTWGRDWACLYRLRMNGTPADNFSGFKE